MKIPFSPPFIDELVIDEVTETLKSGWITTGPKVAALENEIIKLTECKSAICVNSWSSAALLMLKWFGIKEGDEVIVPAYTYSATALSVLHCGAIPVMVDIGNDFTISVEKIKQAITQRTKVIMPVDFAGWPCDYHAINELVNEENVKSMFSPDTLNQKKLGRILVISDAAHSIGAIYNGDSAARMADITIFSFHAVKNITTAEGGGICLNLPSTFDIEAEKEFLKIFSLNGQNKDALSKSKAGGWKYDILYQGLKINMPDICAAIGLSQITRYSKDLLLRRKEIAHSYCEGFRSHNWFLEPPLIDSKRESSYHLFPLRVEDIDEEQRDEIINKLTDRGISANVHFIPMPMFSLFKGLGYDISNYPNAYKQYKKEISLPIYPQLSHHEVNYIITNTIQAVEEVIDNVKAII